MAVRIEQRRDRYLRDVRLVSRGGALELHAIAWTGAWSEPREAHVVFALDDEGAPIGEPREVASADAILGLTREDTPRIARDAGHEDRAWCGDEEARVDRARDGTSRVVLRRGASERVVWEARATACAPAIARGLGGTWIAFHHDLREDTGEVDLAKWIAVRFVDDSGRVLEPAAQMRDRDRDRGGEEQGFELPTLVVGPRGALAILGRGSHAYHRQDLDAHGFAPRTPLDSGAWGCRGRRVAGCAHAGALWLAWREKSGVAIVRAELPMGAAPQLVPARVEHEARVRGGVPQRPSGPDPAARWERRTLFGDIHQHSAHSDGCGTADEPYLRARHVYGDDFCALSDHESFLGKRIGPGEWAHLASVARAHDEPGRFATLFAYEWTAKMHPGPGHKVVYVPAPDVRIASRDDLPEGRALIAQVRAQGGFAVPHHVGWTGADEAAHDPVGQPVWEICSCHGCYLHADHPLGARGDLRDQMVEAVLRRGHRFGFIACSDGHGLLWHHGVGRKRDPFRTGLTAVQASACTREAILAAIRERRCYATSGVPILLDVRAREAERWRPMGSEVRLAGAATLRIEVQAEGSVALSEIALLGAQGVIARVRPGTCAGTLEADVGAGWWYARVEQEDGELAWSSPTFVDP